MLAGCKQPPAARVTKNEAAAERGRDAIRRAGCGACHEISGISWPRGRAGPSLMGFDDRGVIAGTLANTPDTLAAFIRNPSSVKPGSTMPAMPVSEAEARDIAAYLYAHQDD